MKHITEYRDPALARNLVDRIRECAGQTGGASIMEVCGTHTVALFRFGIKQALEGAVRLISGPGCPVCVTPLSLIDKCCLLAARQDVIIATFGDMIRVPGNRSSLQKELASGRDIRVITSPMQALAIARSEPEKRVVLVSVGFETTTPMIAYTLLSACDERVNNLFVICANKLVPPVLKALIQDKDLALDGFLCPGHVSAAIGARAYNEIAHAAGIPCVISGFEPLDMLGGIYELLSLKRNGEAKVVNAYSRVVTAGGNTKAMEVMRKVFEPCEALWRGIGSVPQSGLRLRAEFTHFDIDRHIQLEVVETEDISGCICGEILKGKREPVDCPCFGDSCTPEHPLGACMVSSEGACRAWHRYNT
ncbi:MAG: hydrogenase formation protein HypD [Candidatus Omnitrophica bacterium]|nr:hydrogenase formation protein HypD [Candidatus Omnitrophota bacterium]